MGVKHKYAHHGILCGGQRATCGAGPFLCLYVGSGDRTWVFGFVCQAFCLLSHLTSSHTRWFFSFHPPGAPSIPHHTLANCFVSPPNRHHTMRGPLLTTRRSYNVHQLESCTGSNKSSWHTLRPWDDFVMSLWGYSLSASAEQNGAVGFQNGSQENKCYWLGGWV